MEKREGNKSTEHTPEQNPTVIVNEVTEHLTNNPSNQAGQISEQNFLIPNSSNPKNIGLMVVSIIAGILVLVACGLTIFALASSDEKSATTISTSDPSTAETNATSTTARTTTTDNATETTTTNPETLSKYDWQEFSSEEGKFSAEYPIEPERIINSGLTFWIAEIGNSGYSINYFDIAPETEFDLKNSLDRASESAFGSEIIESEPKVVNGQDCQTGYAEGTRDAVLAAGTMLVCRSTSRVYFVQTIGVKGELEQIDIDRFMNSFKIND